MHAHLQLMIQIRPTLARFMIDGFGDPSHSNGIVVFGADRVVPVGIVSPDHFDEATLRRARSVVGDREFDDWVNSCRPSSFRA